MAKDLLKPLTIKNAEIKEKEYLLNDGEKLYLRVRPNGSKDWFFIYDFGGKKEKIAITGVDIISIRKKAQEFRDLLTEKINPKQKIISDSLAIKEEIKAKEMARLSEVNRVTVNNLFDRWEKLDLINRKDAGKEIRRMFEKDVLPIIGDMAAEDVRKSHVINIIDALLSRGVNRMAKLILSLMRQMFRFAQDRDIIENDPTSSIRKSKIGGKDTIRDRHLSEDEIRSLNSQLPDAKLLKTTECAIWIMLSTCCRIGELSKAKWEDLNFELKTWTIPAENSKNAKPHTIQLSEFAYCQFEKLKVIKKSELWIYPNINDTGHVSEKSITKQIGDRQLTEGKEVLKNRSTAKNALILAGGKWTPHDLRRTGATFMGNLGVKPDVIEKCLNHVEQNKMKRTYQHQALKYEQAKAWRLLGERLEILTSKNTKNVITIDKKLA